MTLQFPFILGSSIFSLKYRYYLYYFLLTLTVVTVLSQTDIVVVVRCIQMSIFCKVKNNFYILTHFKTYHTVASPFELVEDRGVWGIFSEHWFTQRDITGQWIAWIWGIVPIDKFKFLWNLFVSNFWPRDAIFTRWWRGRVMSRIVICMSFALNGQWVLDNHRFNPTMRWRDL